MRFASAGRTWSRLRHAALLFLALGAGCGGDDRTGLPDRRPWRCYTLQFGTWQPGIPRDSLAFLPRAIELDAVLIAVDTPQLGLRINPLAGDRIDVPRSWRPLVPDTIELRFGPPARAGSAREVVVRAFTGERTISGVATAGDGATAVLAGTRVPCD